MRCYLLSGGHIAVEEVSSELSDGEAIEQCRLVFESRRQYFDDFKLWQRSRKVYQNTREVKAN